ncbi:MAG: SDR family NAD(P)-dependent oxidoreductase [Gammaproteobacteria bacterium]|nr:SDR family NAD(P)-dependent oxidoreductase [Gammaproteobacteria bacterium]
MAEQESVLVVGASRGIGLALVERFAAAGWQVHATLRDPGTPGALARLDGDITLHGLDVRDDGQIERLRAAFEHRSLDVLIHNAGIMSKGRRSYDRETVMAVNARAPMRVAEALLDAVARARNGRIVLVSSQLGARQGRSGSLGDYGDSKAALNDALRAAAPAWAERGVTGVVVHPGWVRTDMGGPSASISAAESAAGIYALVGSLSASHSGGFYTWDGRTHPW